MQRLPATTTARLGRWVGRAQQATSAWRPATPPAGERLNGGGVGRPRWRACRLATPGRDMSAGPVTHKRVAGG